MLHSWPERKVQHNGITPTDSRQHPERPPWRRPEDRRRQSGVRPERDPPWAHLENGDEDQAEFDALLKTYTRQYAPANPEQRFLIQQLAESDWRLRRARGLETTFFNQHSDEEILNNREV